MSTNVGNLYGYKNASIQPTDPMHLVYTNSNDLSVNLPIYASDGSLSTCISSVSGNTFDIYPFYYTSVSNCITEIPQDIKLELNNRKLTLKAGSKVYLANGTQNDSYITTVDITSTWKYNGSVMAILSALDAPLFFAPIENCLSGTIANRPSTLPTTARYGFYYATDENKMYLTDFGTTWYSGAYHSLPICIVTISNGAISSIDQVFNGFGYIGSTIFTLPGVKGLISNGKTSTDLLKGVQATTTSVSINSGGGTNQSNITFGLTLTGDLVLNENAIYDATNNYVYDGATEVSQCFCGTFDKVDGRVSNFYVKPINT